MKKWIAVLLEDTGSNAEGRLLDALEAHRLDDDDIESIRRHHWDYWFYPSEETCNDEILRRRYPEEPPELLDNATFVRNLPDDYATSGIITLDGTWADARDFGWRMIKKTAEENEEAWALWSEKVREVTGSNPDAICVNIVIHC